MGEGPLNCQFCGGFSQDCPDENHQPCCPRCLEVGDGHEYDEYDGYTIDVGYVHTLVEVGGACRPDCPHPDHSR